MSLGFQDDAEKHLTATMVSQDIPSVVERWPVMAQNHGTQMVPV